MNVTLRALNRFGLGARQGERQRVSDARGWLKAQLDGGAPALRATESASPAAIGDAVRALRMPGQRDEQERREARRRLVELAASEARAALDVRVTSDRPFVERLVAFWSNHLCVSAGAKILVAPLAGSYERDVIRPHVLGRFEDMVLASARHPAMLAYLDNFQSVGPSSQGARAGQRNNGARRGLNENYARELLELHTLGVNGGYTQEDVRSSRAFSPGGRSQAIAGPGSPVQPRPGVRGRGVVRRVRARARRSARFAFQELLHEPGAKTVLKQRYKEDGVAEGERAIRALCGHPSTARFVATKLATHFISDDPPPAAVDRLARAFRSSEGDLEGRRQCAHRRTRGLARRHAEIPHAAGLVRCRLRAFGSTEVSPNAPAVLRQLRQPLWSPPSPKGFGDTMQEWADPGLASQSRRACENDLASTLGGSRRSRSLLDVVDVPAGNPLHDVDRGHVDPGT